MVHLDKLFSWVLVCGFGWPCIGQYLYVDDMCKSRASSSPQQVYSRAFIQSPTTPTNTYPSNTSCSLSICMNSPKLLIELTQFNIPAELDGSCKDYISIDHSNMLCNANIQGVAIPIHTTNRCLTIGFSSDSDGKTGSGAKIKIRGLPINTGIYSLCSGEKLVQDYGVIASPSYPNPLSGYVNCASTFYLSQSCNLVHIEFVEFFTAALNFLYINSVSYSLSLSSFTTILNVSTTHKMDLNIVFSYPSRTAGQRVLLQYSCVSDGTLISMVDPLLNPVPQAMQPVYITSGLQYMKLVNSGGNQILRYEVSLQTQRNRQSMFYLKSWRTEEATTSSCDDEPISLTVNGQKICGKGSYLSLRTSGTSFNLEMVLNSKEIKRVNDFLLIYEDGIEGIYDVCKQSRLEPFASGFISSPNYPYYYQWNHNCTMTVANLPGNMILLEILDFETEDMTETGRDHDFLRITNLEDQSFIKYDGKSTILRPQMLLMSRNISLNFISDELNHKRGFLIRYSVSRIPRTSTVKATAVTPPVTTMFTPNQDLTTTERHMSTLPDLNKTEAPQLNRDKSSSEDLGFFSSPLFVITLCVVGGLALFTVVVVIGVMCRKRRKANCTVMSDEEVFRTIYAPSPRRERRIQQEMIERHSSHVNWRLGSNSVSLDSISSEKLPTTCSKESLVKKADSSQKPQDKSNSHLAAQSNLTVVRKNSVNMGTQYEPPIPNPPPPPTPPPIQPAVKTASEPQAISGEPQDKITTAPSKNLSQTTDSSGDDNLQPVIVAPIAVKPNTNKTSNESSFKSTAKPTDKLMQGQEHFMFKPIQPAAVSGANKGKATEESSEPTKKFNEIRRDIERLLGAKKQGIQYNDTPAHSVEMSQHSSSTSENYQLPMPMLQLEEALPSTPKILPDPPQRLPPLPPTPPPLPPLPVHRIDTLRF